mgnify:CR=1 FL=1
MAKITLTTGRIVEVPVLANFFSMDSYNGGSVTLHWFDFTAQERLELAEAIKKAYLDRIQDKKEG